MINREFFEALEMQEDLQKKYTGGTVLHLYMNEAISSAEACRDLVRRTLTRFGLPYITVTPTFSICPKHGYLSGRHDFCPLCDAELIAAKKAKLAAHQRDKSERPRNDAPSGEAVPTRRPPHAPTRTLCHTTTPL